MRLWGLKRKEKSAHRFEIRVYLCYRIGALAQLVTLLVEQQAVITAFATDGAHYALYFGEFYVDLTLIVQGEDCKRMLLAEIGSAGFSYEEKRR